MPITSAALNRVANESRLINAPPPSNEHALISANAVGENGTGNSTCSRAINAAPEPTTIGASQTYGSERTPRMNTASTEAAIATPAIATPVANTLANEGAIQPAPTQCCQLSRSGLST